jgi:hypothetical protein
MSPCVPGGRRSPFHLASLLVPWMLVACVATAAAQSSAFEEPSPENGLERLALSLSYGRVESNSLPGGGAGLLSLQAATQPFAPSLGLHLDFRADQLSQNQPGEGWKVKLAGQGVEYGITLGFSPPALPVGFEYHRLAGNSMPVFGSEGVGSAQEYVIDGGASDLYSLGNSSRYHKLRIGYASTGLQANSAPYLLGLHGYLPSPRRAQGPFATLTAERLRFFGFVGRAGAMFILDQSGDLAYSGDFLAWGITLHRALSEKIILGASYMGSSSSVQSDGLPSMFSLYLRLRWSHQPTQQYSGLD